MRLEFDPQLIEETVFLEVRRRERTGKEEVTRAYHREIEPLYKLPLNEPEREKGFQSVNRKFFFSLGLKSAITDLLPRFSILSEFLDRLVFLKAVKRRQEGAELFVREERDESNRSARSGVVYLLPERFLQTEELKDFLLQELLHISDMVDPAFGYDPTLQLEEDFLPQENLIRDRYRILWELYVEKRLRGRSDGEKRGNDRLETLFRKVFACLPHDDCRSLWERLKSSDCFSHKNLLQIAESPREFLDNPLSASEPV